MDLWLQNVEDLRQSKQAHFTLGGRTYTVGELEAVAETKRFGTLSGNHRKAAGWKTIRVVDVADDLDFAFKKLHTVAQRRSTETENGELMRAFCEALERHGMAPEKIGAFIVNNKLSPWSGDGGDVYALIPARFKRSGGYESREPESRNPRFDTPPGPGVRDAPRGVDENITYPCPSCGCTGPHS